MTQTTSDFDEGDWFTVPLSDESFALGRVVRTTPGNPGERFMLAYFFGPRLDSPPRLDETGKRPSDAVLIAVLPDAPIRTGTWPLVGRSHDWATERWRMPSFGYYDSYEDRYWRRDYEDFNVFGPFERTEISKEEHTLLPRDVRSLPQHVLYKLENMLTPVEDS